MPDVKDLKSPSGIFVQTFLKRCNVFNTILACLDIMEPVVDLMLRVQSLDTPMWKLKLWWPRVKAKLSEAGSGDTVNFPRLKKAGDTLKPCGKYKGVELLEGWLVRKDE